MKRQRSEAWIGSQIEGSFAMVDIDGASAIRDLQADPLEEAF